MIMVKRSLLLLVTIVIFFSGCDFSDGKTETTVVIDNPTISKKIATYPVNITDSRGKNIKIVSRPERIVVAGTALYTEILFDLQAGKRVVAVTDSPNNPPEVRNLAKVGRSLQPNLEHILTLQPDLVWGAFGEVRDKLEQAGVLVITTGNKGAGINSVSDILKTIRTVGLAVHGNHRLANQLIGRITEKIVELEGMVLSLPKPKVAIMYAFANVPPMAVGNATPAHELLLRAGADNIFGDITRYKQISPEVLVKKNPDIIFTDPAQKKIFSTNKILKQLIAVKNNKIYGVPASQWNSSRVDKTLQKIIAIIHPKLSLKE